MLCLRTQGGSPEVSPDRSSSDSIQAGLSPDKPLDLCFSPDGGRDHGDRIAGIYDGFVRFGPPGRHLHLNRGGQSDKPQGYAFGEEVYVYVGMNAQINSSTHESLVRPEVQGSSVALFSDRLLLLPRT